MPRFTLPVGLTAHSLVSEDYPVQLYTTFPPRLYQGRRRDASARCHLRPLCSSRLVRRDGHRAHRWPVCHRAQRLDSMSRACSYFEGIALPVELAPISPWVDSRRRRNALGRRHPVSICLGEGASPAQLHVPHLACRA
jgi:hypothetical protein